MAKSFLTDINLNNNVLLNAKIQAWGSAPTGTTNPSGTGTAVAGQISSYAGALYIYNGSAWAAVGTGTVTSVSGTTNQISSTGGSTPQLSLATAFGDNVNPYASKTANYVLAAPNGTAGTPSFRALVAADIPSLGSITNAGAIGSTSGLVIVTGASGALTALAQGGAGTFLSNNATFATPPNYYPTAVTMTAGTTAGPTVDLTMTGTTNITGSAIPSATGTASGVVTTGAQTFAGVKTFNSLPESSVVPTTANQLVNKTYVDTIATGINAHEAVSYASAAEITGTYSNGTAGVGATLTGTGSLVIDGYTVVSGDAGTNVQGGTGLRVLLKDQTTNTDQNGIYAVTACTSGTSWTLTRAYDYDALGEVAAGDFTYVLLQGSGGVNAKFTFVETSKPAAISGVGTALNAITFGVFANGNLSGTVNVNQGGTGANTFTSGGILRGNGTSALSVASAADIVAAISTTAVTNATNATNATNVAVTADTTTSSAVYPTFVTTTSGNLPIKVNSTSQALNYVPSTGTLTATILRTYSGTITGPVLGGADLNINPASVSTSATADAVNIAGGANSTATTGTGGPLTLKGGALSNAAATGTAGSVTISGGTATAGTVAATAGAVSIAGGASNTTAGIGGAVTIAGGAGFTKGAISIGTANTASVTIGTTSIATTIYGTTSTLDTANATFKTNAVTSGSGATTANVVIGTGIATGTGAAGTSGNVLVDVGYATGTTSTAGQIKIGTQTAAGSSNVYAAPAAISIGQSGVTTTVTGGLSIPTIASATGLLKTTITTGVVGLATAGTDYVVPSGTVAKATNVVGGVLGSVPYQSAADTTLFVAPNTSATKNFLSQTGTGSAGALPAWGALAYTDLPTTSLTGVTTDGIARKKTGQLTANSSTTAFAIAHGFGQWVTAQLFDTSGNLVEVDVSNAATGTPAGTTTFTFATAPTTGTNYQYVIIG